MCFIHTYIYIQMEALGCFGKLANIGRFLFRHLDALSSQASMKCHLGGVSLLGTLLVGLLVDGTFCSNPPKKSQYTCILKCKTISPRSQLWKRTCYKTIPLEVNSIVAFHKTTAIKWFNIPLYRWVPLKPYSG